MKYLIILMVVLLSYTNSANAYDFKIKDPYESTVFGTSEENKAVIKSAPFRLGELKLEKAKKVPQNFWFNKKLRYAKAIQDDLAPLAFLIAGTGGNHLSPKIKDMASILYNLGYSVVTLPSPSHSNFIVSASSTSSVGEIKTDIKDLKHVIKKITLDLIENDDAKISYYVTGGYSLGASHAAFLTYYADIDKNYPIKFSKALLVNPPVDILESAMKIDKIFLDNVGEDNDDFLEFYESLYSKIDQQYQEMGGIYIGPGIFFEMYKNNKFKRRDLKSAIGAVFRVSSADMVYSIDVMRKMGVIVPKDITVGEYDSLRDYINKSLSYGFTKYSNEMLTKIYNMPLEELSANTSLKAIEKYIKNSNKLYLMHNQNDFILKDGDIDYFKKIFGKYAKIYPYGGHCGNMSHKDNVAHMQEIFKLEKGE